MLLGSTAKRARMLAVLLLASLAWSTTVEFTHHHGAQTRFGESPFSATQSPDADSATSTQIQSRDTNGTSSKSKTDVECLICQLQQNLSATVIGHTPDLGPTETLGINTPTTVVVELSEIRSCGQGRAPPSYL